MQDQQRRFCQNCSARVVGFSWGARPAGLGKSAGTMSGRMFSKEDVEGRRRGYKPAVSMTG